MAGPVTPPRDRPISVTTEQLYALYDVDTQSVQLSPSIEVQGGTVDIYGSQTVPASPPVGMILAPQGSNFSGLDRFGVVPNYIYIASVSGTPVINITGVQLRAIV
jgi:hypothetical protein